MVETREPELAEHLEQIETQNTEVSELTERLTQVQFDWRPGPDRWSVGEHLAHLTLTNRPYLEAIGPALSAARAAGWTGRGPFRYGWLGNWFARSMEPPPRMRVRTARRLEPHAGRTKEEVAREFAVTQEMLARAIREADGLDLRRASIRSPFLKVFKLSVGQAFNVLMGHNRRHLWHIRQIAADPAQPAG